MSVEQIQQWQWGPVRVQSTPWDTAVFGLPTAEFFIPDRFKAEELEEGLRLALNSRRFELIYGRVSASVATARILLAKAFFACETQISFSLSERKYRSIGSPISQLTVKPGGDCDYLEVIAASNGLFPFSRFHEDPLIRRDRADARMVAWVRDLATSKAPLLVARSSTGRLIGFMFYKQGENADLTLGGCTPEASFLAPKFWRALLDYLFANGSRSIKAGVSAANTSMLRVYVDLGFNISSTRVDYHWHSNPAKLGNTP